MKFGVLAAYGVVFVDSNYSWGSALSSSAVWSNETLAGLGLTQGQYTYSLGSDQPTVNIGTASAVPEPASWGMLVTGFGVIGATMRRRRRLSVWQVDASQSSR